MFSYSLNFDAISNPLNSNSNSQDNLKEINIKDKVNIIRNRINLRLNEENTTQQFKSTENKDEILYLEDSYRKKKLKRENNNNNKFIPDLKNTAFDSVTVVEDFKNQNLYSISEDNDSFANGENTRIIYGIKIKPNKKDKNDSRNLNDNLKEENFTGNSNININNVKLHSSAKFAGFLSLN